MHAEWLRRNTMQGLKFLASIADEIISIDAKFEKVTGA